MNIVESFGFYYERGKRRERLEILIKRLGIISFYYGKAITNSMIWKKGLILKKIMLICFYISFMMISVEHE